MAAKPIIFAMANPDLKSRRRKGQAPPVATRSSPPAEAIILIRSTMFSASPISSACALDVRASTINDTMKIAAAEALAQLAREDVPDEVHSASAGRRLTFGPEYIIPNAFDPRLITRVPPAVARAAIDPRRAGQLLTEPLRQRADRQDGSIQPPTLDAIMERVRRIRAGSCSLKVKRKKSSEPPSPIATRGWQARPDRPRGSRPRHFRQFAGLGKMDGIEIHNARLSSANPKYTDFLHERLQRSDPARRDCQRMVTIRIATFSPCRHGRDGRRGRDGHRPDALDIGVSDDAGDGAAIGPAPATSRLVRP